METFLRMKNTEADQRKKYPHPVAQKRWRCAVSSTINNSQKMKFPIVVNQAVMRAYAAQWKNSKFQMGLNEDVEARVQNSGNNSPSEPHAAPVSGSTLVVAQCASQAESWEVRATLSKFLTSMGTYITLGFRDRTEQNVGEPMVELNPCEQIEVDIHNQTSLPSHNTPEISDTGSYLDDDSLRQINEWRENVRAITCNQVVVDNPYATSPFASSLERNPQELISSSSSCEPSLNYLENKTNSMFPGKEITTDVVIPISQVARPLCKTPCVQDTSSSLVGLSQIPADKVESNANVAVRDQTNGDVLDTALFRQAQIESQEISSFHIEPLNNFSSQAQQNAFGIVNDDSGTGSQPAEQPTQADVVAESQAQSPVLKAANKAIYLVAPISSAGLVGAVAQLMGDKKTYLTHVLFKAYASLSFVSVVLVVGLHILTLKPPSSQRLVIIINITNWVTIGSFTYSVSCAAALLLATSLYEVVIVFVVPPAVVFSLIILIYKQF